LARGEEAPGLVTGTAREDTGRTVFVFPGQGSQWAGMGRDLYQTSPVFRTHLDTCAQALDPHTGWNLVNTLTGTDDTWLHHVDTVQPALFATMVALAQTWRTYGIEPDAVIGHSQGEIAAAHIAGALTLDDAARIVTLRSRTLKTLAGTGGMTSINLPATHVHELLTTNNWHHHLTIAAHNGPTNTIVAGTPQALDTLTTHCEHHNIRARRIPVDYASHSPHIEPLHHHLTTLLADINPQPTTHIAFYSTLTNTHIHDTTTLNADYWYENLRRPVQFEATTRTLLANGHTTYIETSPHPVLTTSIQETAEHTTTHTTTIPTLRRDHGTLTHLLTNLAHAHTTTNTPINWTPHHPTNPTPTNLPTYPFQHQHYWL
ncbi:acyltransferase domain-containing protein, partial [Kitasatospora sp. NPDC052868]|uniref:acyltransferase domain-containing protein n=1 Tax=Kitasatospora sp. NPDC052868 TaxID=3364060 RepID=UPI0037C57727